MFPNYIFECIHENCQGLIAFEGWPSNPSARRIYSMGISYFIARMYRCTTCQRKFNAANPIFLQSLPIYMQDMFPAQLTHRAGIDKNLLNYVYALISEGTSPNLIRNILKELLYLNDDRSRLQYYSICRDLILGSSSRTASDISLAFSTKEGITVHKFWPFSNPSGYHEAISIFEVYNITL
jgi:hypothetical protein